MKIFFMLEAKRKDEKNVSFFPTIITVLHIHSDDSKEFVSRNNDFGRYDDEETFDSVDRMRRNDSAMCVFHDEFSNGSENV